jgi:hypothetical protein
MIRPCRSVLPPLEAYLGASGPLLWLKKAKTECPTRQLNPLETEDIEFVTPTPFENEKMRQRFRV